MWRTRLDDGPASRRKLDPKILGACRNSMLFRPAFHSQNRQQRDHRSQCAACRESRQIQEKAQDYSGFALKSQTPNPKSAQLASRPPAHAAGCRRADHWQRIVGSVCPWAEIRQPALGKVGASGTFASLGLSQSPRGRTHWALERSGRTSRSSRVSFRGDPCLVELPIAQPRCLNAAEQHFFAGFLYHGRCGL